MYIAKSIYILQIHIYVSFNKENDTPHVKVK